jgi:3-hydroxyisobutyrate dehydrogenase-like beta-hydroxyacid dehydrogenase
MDVGFVGLGNMGSALATRLLQAGHRLTVWNRTPAAADALVAQGAERAADPAAAFQGEAVLTMLSDDAAVRAVVLDGGVLERASRGLVHVVCSTLSVGFVQQLVEAHRRAGLAYVAAPVMGRPDAVRAGKANLLAAGAPEAVARVRPLLDALGQKTWPIAERPDQANVAKLAMNFSLASVIEVMGEAFALARAHDLDPARLYEVMTGTLFDAAAFRTYGPIILERRFSPAGFALRLGLKDVREALAAGEMAGAPLPFASVVRDNFVDAMGHGDADKDWAALAQVSARRAGQ